MNGEYSFINQHMIFIMGEMFPIFSKVPYEINWGRWTKYKSTLIEKAFQP